MLGMGGLGKMDPQKMQKLMNKLNIKMDQVDAEEVIIKKKDKTEIVITEPEVVIVDMQGRDVYQITGNAKERSPKAVRDEDVKMIMKQTGKDKEEVEKALAKLNNDLAKTIMELKRR
ncbi:MAG: nascent polypeptide-associated complex protein [Candidatus Aenigmatarchaeota archaeon]